MDGDFPAAAAALPLPDLIAAVALSAGLFPEDRVFVPAVPAVPRCCHEEG